MADEIKRAPRDGKISVNRYGAEIVISAEDCGDRQGMTVSEWQARRILAALSMVLQLPLSAKALREIDAQPATTTPDGRPEKKFTMTPFRRALLMRLPLSQQNLTDQERRQLNDCRRARLVKFLNISASMKDWDIRFVLTEKGRAALAEPPAPATSP